MENHTAKHFVLQLGALVSMYLSVSFLLVLVFGLITLLFPDAADTVYDVEQATGTIRLGISMTIVFFPTYLVLTRLVNTARRQDAHGSYLGLTKWLIYLSLLIGGAALLIDLVVVIQAFLEGDITVRFILKALAVLVVIGSAFYYYLLDARGTWIKNEKQSITYGVCASVVVLVAIILGFANIETPAEVREQKLDDTQISDLQNIQWQIADYLAIHNELPTDLDGLYTSTSIPTAPDTRPAYEYQVTEGGFALCATFANSSQEDKYLSIARPIINQAIETPTIINPDNWQHGAGEYCFNRTVKIPQ